jgi:hemerythrin
MAFLEWTDRLSVNIDSIDRQHQVLVKWMNHFYDAADQNNHSVAKNALQQLVKYTKLHFEDEERMMIKADYFDYEKHSKVHIQLLDLVTRLINNYNSSPSKETAAELSQFLKSWLTNHIMGIDKKYSESVIESNL